MSKKISKKWTKPPVDEKAQAEIDEEEKDDD